MLGRVSHLCSRVPAAALPWPSGLGASLARHVRTLLVAAHLQPSARVAGAGALEVGAVFGGAWRCMRAVMVAFVVVIVLVMAALGALLRRRLLQRCLQAAVAVVRRLRLCLRLRRRRRRLLLRG